ncbi:MAG: HU family DNA-binding protein [Ardenticatenales bacterium]|nr:HU family DNA-binding protein [Ardenticatenales bacterium]
MATWIEAISAYRPRVSTLPTLDLDALAERLASGTLLTPRVARMVLEELGHEIGQQLRTGHRVKLPGIGTFGPRIRLDGTMRATLRLAPELRDAVTDVGTFLGGITGRESVGLDLIALKERWDAEHPDDPLELPPNYRSRAKRTAA